MMAGVKGGREVHVSKEKSGENRKRGPIHLSAL